MAANPLDGTAELLSELDSKIFSVFLFFIFNQFRLCFFYIKTRIIFK